MSLISKKTMLHIHGLVTYRTCVFYLFFFSFGGKKVGGRTRGRDASAFIDRFKKDQWKNVCPALIRVFDTFYVSEPEHRVKSRICFNGYSQPFLKCYSETLKSSKSVSLFKPCKSHHIYIVVARGVGVRFHESSAEPLRVWENRMKNPGIEGVCGM